MSQLISDLQNIRASSLSFVNTLSAEQLAIKGFAREHEVSLEDFLRSIIGHERHHLEVIKRKYLPKPIFAPFLAKLLFSFVLYS